MRVAILTREFPPEVYGGAGVHVAHLVEELRTRADVDVHCFGADRPGATAYRPTPALAHANPALATLGVDVQMAAALGGHDVVHSHTWYANLAGHLASLLHGAPHVVTAHSLEPQRPWKAEQLGGGYRLSSWAEQTAYESADAIIAVSEGMRADVLEHYPATDPARVHVVLNGIDTDLYHRVDSTDRVRELGVDLARPYVLFVGRITRQKGLEHLLQAAEAFDAEAQLVLAAGAPDTPQLAASTAAAVEKLRAARTGVVWLEQMLDRSDVIELLSHAAVFVCPSVYEPLGIVNLEAMACETAVVASMVGGIPEVVADGETGLLVPFGAPAQFAEHLSWSVNSLLRNPERAAAMGRAGRERAFREFAWAAIADQTIKVYESVRR